MHDVVHDHVDHMYGNVWYVAFRINRYAKSMTLRLDFQLIGKALTSTGFSDVLFITCSLFQG